MKSSIKKQVFFKYVHKHIYASMYIQMYIKVKCIRCRRYERSAQLTEGGAVMLLGSQGSYSYACMFVLIGTYI